MKRQKNRWQQLSHFYWNFPLLSSSGFRIFRFTPSREKMLFLFILCRSLNCSSRLESAVMVRRQITRKKKEKIPAGVSKIRCPFCLIKGKPA